MQICSADLARLSAYLITRRLGSRGPRSCTDEGGLLAEFLLSLLALAVSIGFAWVFYRLVEKPAHAFARLLRLRQGKSEFRS